MTNKEKFMLLVSPEETNTLERIKDRIAKRMTAGGYRPNSGRKLKYGEPVKRLLVKVPVSKEKEIKAKIEEVLKPYIVKPK